jgi:hypothetical protein
MTQYSGFHLGASNHRLTNLVCPAVGYLQHLAKLDVGTNRRFHEGNPEHRAGLDAELPPACPKNRVHEN